MIRMNHTESQWRDSNPHRCGYEPLVLASGHCDDIEIGQPGFEPGSPAYKAGALTLELLAQFASRYREE